jgi:hypothetical protein
LGAGLTLIWVIGISSKGEAMLYASEELIVVYLLPFLHDVEGFPPRGNIECVVDLRAG